MFVRRGFVDVGNVMNLEKGCEKCARAVGKKRVLLKRRGAKDRTMAIRS